MDSAKRGLGILLLTALLAPGLAFAASAKKYQVTGKVLEVTDTTIVVEKGDEKWEISRDAKTKVDGDLKVGEKVTVGYRMVADSIEVKAEKAKSK
jgi:RNase P/RNase MRP subunit p29